MPVIHLMSWQATARRWWKQHDGKRFVISVRQLQKHFNDPTIPETKEGSWSYANRWWTERLATTPIPTPKVEPTTQPLIQLEDGTVLDDPANATLVTLLLLQEFAKQGKRMPKELVEGIIGKERREELHKGVQKLLHPTQTPPERTVGELVDRYLATVYKRHQAGDISVSEYANARAGLVHFRDFVGSKAAIETVDPARWQSYYDHLISPDGPQSVVSRRKNWRYSRNFLQWLDDLGVQPAPRNLFRKQYRFKGGDKAVPVATEDALTATLEAAKGQMKLHLLLMLNCGFTQQDVADLSPDEVDWEGGRIRRKRSKTGEHGTVPVVDYRLWDETFVLLKRFRSGDKERVLLTGSGKPWVRDEVASDGKRSRTDAIQSVYRKLVVTGKPTLKVLRKTASTTLNNSSEHGKFAAHFLGHAPTVAHRHYLQQNGPFFDSAVRWLGEQFGYATTR